MEGVEAQGRETREDLGLRLLRRAVAEGGSVKTITAIRNGCAEDGIPEAVVDATYEAGFREFDAARTAAALSLTSD